MDMFRVQKKFSRAYPRTRTRGLWIDASAVRIFFFLEARVWYAPPSKHATDFVVLRPVLLKNAYFSLANQELSKGVRLVELR